MAKFNLKEHIAKNKATFFGSLTEGQFSWMTQDTGQQIGSQDENIIPVYMFDDKGKYYYENDYEGYGVFGGKDYYDLVAEMNGYTVDDAEELGGMFKDLRGVGIKLAFGELEPKNGGPVLFPALVTKPDKFNYKSHDFTQEAETDPNQSWYEPEEDEEDNSFDSDDDEDYGYNDDEEELDENMNKDASSVAEKFAQYMSKKEGRKFTVTAGSVDEKSFDLNLDGMEYEGGSYLINYNGDIVNVAAGNEIYGNVDQLEEGYKGQFYAPEYLEKKYGKEMAKKIEAEIDEMDENSWDRFTGMESAEEVDEYVADIVNMLKEGEAAYEYEKGKEAGEKIEKKKMKVSEFKAQIREMILAEMDGPAVEDSQYDFLKEIEEMLDEAEGLTPLQDYVYQYEIEISGEDRAQDFLDDIKQLNTPQDVYDYYAYGRELQDYDVDNIFRQVKRKFANLASADDLTPLQRRAYNYTKERFGNEEAKNSLDQIKTLTTGQEFTDWVNQKLKNLSEAEEDTADAEAAADAGAEDTEVTDTEITTDVTTSEVDPNVKAVQDALTQAQAAAQQLGDKKLMDQIGNTITFFTRAHVVEKPKGTVAETNEKSINENTGETLEIKTPEDLKKVEGSQIFKYDVFDKEDFEQYKVYILADDKSQAEKIAKEKFPKQFPPYKLDTGYPQKSSTAENLWTGKEKNSFWYGVEKTGAVAENLKETLLLQKRAGIITEAQYKQKLNEVSEDEVPLTPKVKSFINKAIADSKKDGEFENLKEADWFENELIDELIDLFPNKDYDSASEEVMDYISQAIK